MKRVFAAELRMEAITLMVTGMIPQPDCQKRTALQRAIWLLLTRARMEYLWYQDGGCAGGDDELVSRGERIGWKRKSERTSGFLLELHPTLSAECL